MTPDESEPMIDQAVQQNRGRAFAVGANDEIRGLYGIAKWLLVLNLFDGVYDSDLDRALRGPGTQLHDERPGPR